MVALSRGKRIKGQPGLHNEFLASQGYIARLERDRENEDKPDPSVIPTAQKVKMDLVVLRKHKAKLGGGGACF